VDVLTFPNAGIYLLVDQIYSSDGIINHVNVWSYCTNVGVSSVSSSANGTIVTDSFYSLSFAMVSVSADATISFPDSSYLTTLYGADWAAAYCAQLTIVRIS